MPDPDTAKHGVKPKGSRAIRFVHLMGVHFICMHLTGRVAQKAGTGEL
jgi:hypothetical protein